MPRKPQKFIRVSGYGGKQVTLGATRRTALFTKDVVPFHTRKRRFVFQRRVCVADDRGAGAGRDGNRFSVCSSHRLIARGLKVSELLTLQWNSQKQRDICYFDTLPSASALISQDIITPRVHGEPAPVLTVVTRCVAAVSVV